MAERTGIAWTRSTFNPWIGCTEVSPGCDACYARELDKRHRYGGATHWGAGIERYVTSLSSWLKPGRWNDIAIKERASGRIEDRSDWHTPGFWPVFPSMCDPFDKEVDDGLRETFWHLILDTPSLDWLLLTKRIGNAAKMLPAITLPNVWIGASVVNQEEANRDIPKLMRTPAAKRFVSYEPALGPIDFTMIARDDQEHPHPAYYDLADLDQIIVGGESNQGKHKARPFNIEWARSTREQCRAAGVAFFMKQTGSDHALLYERIQKDRAGADPAEWPEDLRVQEFPA